MSWSGGGKSVSQPPASDLIFLDSNIPMYALGRIHPYQEPCRRILHAIGTGEIDAATSAEVHQEILHRYLSLHLGQMAIAVSERFEEAVPNILAVTIPDIRRARELSVTYGRLPARDLIHVAVMLNNRITTIASADRHFDQVAEIVRLDPMQWTPAGSV